MELDVRRGAHLTLPRTPDELTDAYNHALPQKRRLPSDSVEYRVLATLKQARYEEKRFATRARQIGWLLSLCVALQVVFGTLITALAAAGGGKQQQLSIAFLGGANTVVASVMARVHFMAEPETSRGKSRELKKFIRHCVPLAWPASTLKKPNGIRALDTQVSPGLSRVVVAFRPSTSGFATKKVSNGAPVALTFDGLYIMAWKVTSLGLTSNSR